jgi:hypothetical protein
VGLQRWFVTKEKIPRVFFSPRVNSGFEKAVSEKEVRRGAGQCAATVSLTKMMTCTTVGSRASDGLP